MLDIPKTLLNRVKNEGDLTLLENYLMNNHPMPQIIKAFAELIVASDDVVNKEPIPVSQEEYDSIMSLLRVKGLRVGQNGEVIKETRGRRPRKRLDSPFETVEDNPTLDM